MAHRQLLTKNPKNKNANGITRKDCECLWAQVGIEPTYAQYALLPIEHCDQRQFYYRFFLRKIKQLGFKPIFSYVQDKCGDWTEDVVQEDVTKPMQSFIDDKLDAPIGAAIWKY